MCESEIKKRDNSIDILRAISMILIVLAHVNAPYVITQLRSFDVPLIVMVSGFCYTGCKKGYGQYVIKRLKRIYYPVFKFLLIFLGPFIALKLLGYNIPWNWNQIFGSFLLLDEPSIGFVWIMRVFLLMALIAPVTSLIVRKFKQGA
ncbi:MAG: acyltransferase family protein [Muribaculaceae bacterium]|nr:acyltransferase family protein [Muribaculaceae bacterium]